MLTSRTSERHRAHALDLGASGYLTKPYRPEDVVKALRDACGPAMTAA
jgi:DNA-binding response OmpR family regulator